MGSDVKSLRQVGYVNTSRTASKIDEIAAVRLDEHSFNYPRRRERRKPYKKPRISAEVSTSGLRRDHAHCVKNAEYVRLDAPCTACTCTKTRLLYVPA
jgi:hypothetical protein